MWPSWMSPVLGPRHSGQPMGVYLLNISHGVEPGYGKEVAQREARTEVPLWEGGSWYARGTLNSAESVA